MDSIIKAEYEKDELVAICDRLGTLKHSSVNPMVFTEQGVSMLSSVLHQKANTPMSPVGYKIVKNKSAK